MPMQDDKNALPVCFRCGSSNSLVARNDAQFGEACTNCKHPFIRCFVSFDVLPLVEFIPIEGITENEAADLICQYSANTGTDKHSFDESINSALNDHVDEYIPIVLDRECLKDLNREEVFVIKKDTESINQWHFYKNMIPEIGIALCPSCHHFFHEGDYEYSFLQKEECPVCSASNVSNVSDFLITMFYQTYVF